MVTDFYIGVDVGTSSVRAALVDELGSIVKTCVIKTSIHSPQRHFYEQSSTEIWESCCQAIRNVSVNTAPEQVHGIAFDATCSLVVLDAEFQPLSVGPSGDDGRNIIMWLDHRADQQAQQINLKNHNVLRYVGGKMSLEMQSPKLMWLKQNLPKTWKRAAHFFDLPDFLTWKATGALSRSICSLACKWTYLPKYGWSKDFWDEIGLEDLTSTFEKIGTDVKQIGECVGEGISQKASKETGLKAGTAVAVSIIDAHCGGIGSIGCSLVGTSLEGVSNELGRRIALICGTSSCHMAISRLPLQVPGVWGPYEGVMIPGYWLSEGGQSAVANLLDHVVQSHPAYSELKFQAEEREMHINGLLNHILVEMAEKTHCEYLDMIAKHNHVLPDFHGNRSPLADPHMTGAIYGLTLDQTIEGLALLYLATLQGLALGTKHILDEMEKSGHSFDSIFISGGLRKNDLFVQIHANATGLPIVLTREEESVLLGGAILAACASGRIDLENAMKKMCHVGKVINPQKNTSEFYKKKYIVFMKMIQHHKECRKIME